MKNINYNPDFLYVIVDMLTDGILWATKSKASACAISLFSSRLRAFPIETHAPWLSDEIKQFNYRDLKINKGFSSKQGKRKIIDLPSDTVTKEYISFRKEIISRIHFHFALATNCDLAMRTVTENPYLVDYAESILSDLAKSDPTKDIYTDGIRSYAQATDCEPNAAYQELKLHMDSLSNVRLRNLGIYIKYRNQLNQSPGTPEAQQTIIDSAIKELFLNSLV